MFFSGCYSLDLKSIFAKNSLLCGVAAVLLVAAVAFLIQPAAVGPLASPTPGASIVPESGALSLLINEGANYTKEATVLVSIDYSGFEECRYSSDGEAWTDYSAPEEKFDWDFPPVDGDKEFYVQCRSGEDFARDIACIILDSTPPSISIDSPEEFSTVASPFAFEFFVTDEYSPSFDCVAHLDNALVPVGSIESHFLVNLTASDGIHNVSVECVDEAGNQKEVELAFAVGEPAVPTPMVRPTPSPTPGIAPYSLDIKVNGGDASTALHSVYLDLSAIGANTCSYSNDDIAYSAWESYSTYKQWTLADGAGTRTVYYRCVNSYGQSQIASDSIAVLDGYATPTPTAPPYGLSVQVNSDAIYATDEDVTLFLAAISAEECRYSNDGVAYSDWSAFSSEKNWALVSGDGEKTVYYQCKNSFASSIAVHDTIMLDSTPPSTVNDFHLVDVNLQEGTASFDWSDSTDALSGVKEYWVYRNDNAVTPFEKIAMVIQSDFTDTPPDLMGPWYYYVKPVDNAGNEGDASNVYLFAIA